MIKIGNRLVRPNLIEIIEHEGKNVRVFGARLLFKAVPVVRCSYPRLATKQDVEALTKSAEKVIQEMDQQRPSFIVYPDNYKIEVDNQPRELLAQMECADAATAEALAGEIGRICASNAIAESMGRI